jgi:hypothetical protein
MTTLDQSPSTSRERLAIAAGAAILVAGVLLVTVVMPAEYAVDPLGTGARLGLLPLGETGKQVAALNASAAQTAGEQGATVVPQPRPFVRDTENFTIAPGQGMEYKYRLQKGQALLYTWKATAPVNFEFHAEPDGAPRGYAQTYEKRDATLEASGTLTAPFPGIHGWYWENKTASPVTVTLQTAGFYSLAHEFLADGVRNKTFD